MSSRALRRAYTLWAPFYDLAVQTVFRASRRRSVAPIEDRPERIALIGVGTGLDLPWLPPGPRYTALDLTPPMLARARRRALALGRRMDAVQGDAMALPFRTAAFDRVVLHLILAVVPHPAAALHEAARVVKPGGFLHVFDKFLLPRRSAPLRRLISPVLGRLATRTDVVFEDVLAGVPELTLVSDVPDLGRGWFRRILLRRAS